MARLVRYLAVRGLVVLALAATSCSSTMVDEQAIVDDVPVAEQPAEEDTSGPSDADLGPALRTEFEDWATAAEGGGVAFVRSADGQAYTFAAGEDPQTGEPLDADDRVRVGSISKIYTSVLMLQLVDQGLVELDAPVSTYVDGLSIANDVTIRQLLSHQTGIPNYTDSQGFFTVIVANPERKPLPEDLVAFTNGESDFEPGSQFAYSNTNFIIAGMVIEAVTEGSLAVALERQIAEPLQLTATAFDDGTITDVAGGYSALTPSGNSFDQPYTSIAYGSWAAGGLITTTSELATFLDATLRGDLISVESRQSMMDGVDSVTAYGLGLAAGSDFGVGHRGSIVGFNSSAEIDLDTGEIVIVVVNNDSRNPDVATSLLADVLRDT